MKTNPIRAILEDAGWTPSELAALLGVSPQRINTLWNGHRRWSDRMVLDLLTKLEGRNVRDELVERIRRAAGE